MTIFTIGHSCLSIDDFIRLLKLHGITAVADVRSQPHSKRFPHFSRRPLSSVLGREGIHHVFLGRELGARREEPECYRAGVARYELIAAQPAFRSGLARLAEGAVRIRIALMCAEKDHLACHRSILVARHLQEMGLEVAHILGDGLLEKHMEAERRLMLEEGFVPGQMDIFGGADDSQSLTAAYAKRGEKICYRDMTGEDDEDIYDRLHA